MNVLKGIGAILAGIVFMGIAPTWYPIALVVLALPCVWLGVENFFTSWKKLKERNAKNYPVLVVR
jgi:hypothetical protein